jgi:hypothetical protein
VVPQVEPDHALAVRMSLHSNLPLHAPPFAWSRVTHGAGRGCVRGALPGCASPVLAIAGAHLLSVPRSRAGPVGAAQRDRVPEMPSRRLVASALIRPIVRLPVRSLRRRHLHPYPCRPPLRLRARTESWQGAHASCPGQGFRRPLWSYHSEPRTGPSLPRRCMRPQGHERVEGPICAFEAALSRRRRLVEPPGARHLSRMSCSPQSTQ